MKERVGGGNEVLIPLVKILKYQEYCEWILKKDVKDSYLVLPKNELCWCHEGLIEKFPSIVVELCLNGVIEVDIASHTLIRVNGEEVKGIEHAKVLDLSDDGERWEGDVKNNQPYGWGVLYDSESRRAYEGFRIGEVNVCYGRSYYPDVQKVEYEGEICEGKRWGRGIQYDRNGKTVFDGEWINDEQLNKRVVLNEENQFLHNHIEELIVESNSCNGPEWAALDLSLMPCLRLLKVGDECFESVKEVKLIGLSKLERVVIGEKSFTKKKNRWPSYDPNRHFYLKNCERLRELKIGRYSFSDYFVCEIENVPSLRLLEVGDDCFDYVDEVKLIGLSKLERVVIGKNSFTKPSRFFGDNPARHFYLKNCERLRELKMGCYSFYDYSVCEIENVPSLEVIEMGDLNEWSFNFRCASLELKSDYEGMN